MRLILHGSRHTLPLRLKLPITVRKAVLQLGRSIIREYIVTFPLLMFLQMCYLGGSIPIYFTHLRNLCLSHIIF